MANGLIDFGSLRPNAAMEAYQQGQQNQLAQMQLAQQQQAIRDAEAEREAYKGASSFGEVSQRLMQQGLGKQALAVSAAEAKQRADKIALLKDTTALMKTTATQIMADPTIAESALVQFGKQTGHDITNDLAQLRALGGDPDKTRLWAASHALEADKLLPKFETRDLGGTVERQGYNVVTGKAIGPADVRKKTATPGELMTDARARENIKIAQENQRREADPVFQQQLAEAKALGQNMAKDKALRATQLPKVLDTAEMTLNEIDALIGKRDKDGNLLKGQAPHPGFETAVGATYLPGARFVPGTSASDFQSRFDQIKGGAFLQAFETLKGGGSITNVEGDKGTAALNRMSLAQSEKEFVQAAREFQDIVRKGVERASKSAGAPVPKNPSTPAPGATPPPPPGFNPD